VDFRAPMSSDLLSIIFFLLILSLLVSPVQTSEHLLELPRFLALSLLVSNLLRLSPVPIHSLAQCLSFPRPFLVPPFLLISRPSILQSSLVAFAALALSLSPCFHPFSPLSRSLSSWTHLRVIACFNVRPRDRDSG